MSAFARFESSDRLYLTDSGLETTLIFHEGYDLPVFAAYPLLGMARGRDTLRDYYRRHAGIAREHGAGFVFETPTWRANADWGRELGHDEAELREVNADAVALMRELAGEFPSDVPFLISGNIGPRGDGYVADAALGSDAARDYHAPQIRTFAEAGVDLVSAFTLSTADEAIGIAQACDSAGVPCVIAFTVETDGALPDGTPLGKAIAKTDRDVPSAVAHYMINCAHPDHFFPALEGDWTKRVGAVRCNASRMSHAELDEAEELDDGDPQDFGALHAALRERLPNLRVVGGCCGSDHRHVDAAARTLCA